MFAKKFFNIISFLVNCSAISNNLVYAIIQILIRKRGKKTYINQTVLLVKYHEM